MPTTFKTPRVRGFVLVALAGSLTACASPNFDDRSTGSLPRDFRERHPVVITDEARTLDVPVGQGDAQLPEGTRETILGFLARYRVESEGVIQIARPSGAANAATAANAAREVAELFSLAGVPESRVVRSTYAVAGDAIAPVRLAYTAVRATVADCGMWPEDLASPEQNHDNRNYHNFGCATQNNLAAQIANPTDLLHPRESSPIDASRQNEIIDDYRDNGNSALTIAPPAQL